MQEFSSQMKREGKKIGFVPTMGYLHEGHLSLVRKAKESADIIVVSIFVNPTQFAPNEDFTKYPRDEKRDIELLENENVDVLFFPSGEEIYPKDFQTYVDVIDITQKQEGEFRPAHFKGVTTIVSILFNCVMPDVAVFGQKDAQQAAAIKQMVKDLKFNLKVEVAPIVREKDGLAMSSRNVYLNKKERKEALILNKSLLTASGFVESGEKKAKVIFNAVRDLVRTVDSAKMEYFRIVDKNTFEEAEHLISGKKYYLLIACKIGNTRLIDNVEVKA